ncbi:MAG: hypothetical protein ACI86M_003729, partial [Saprospiraceae bacterium]
KRYIPKTSDFNSTHRPLTKTKEIFIHRSKK